MGEETGEEATWRAIREEAKAAGVTGPLGNYVVDRGPETEWLLAILADRGIWFHYRDIPDFRDYTDRGILTTADELGHAVAAYYAASRARLLRGWIDTRPDLPDDVRERARGQIADADASVERHRQTPGFVELA